MSSRELTSECAYFFLALQSDESLMIWNFFGNDCQYTRCKTQRKHTQSDTRSTNFKEFEYYNIR